MSPLLDAILSGVGYVGEALDAPGAYLRGALAGDLGERRSGREMLEAWGLLGENEEGLDFGDVAGFGADMLLDPLNLIGGGLLGKTAKAASTARGINAASDAARSHNLLVDSARAKADDILAYDARRQIEEAIQRRSDLAAGKPMDHFGDGQQSVLMNAIAPTVNVREVPPSIRDAMKAEAERFGGRYSDEAVLDIRHGDPRQVARGTSSLLNAPLGPLHPAVEKMMEGANLRGFGFPTKLVDDTEVRGFVQGIRPDYVFVADDLPIPSTLDAGTHELTHVLARKHPEAYARMEGAIGPDAVGAASSEYFGGDEMAKLIHTLTRGGSLTREEGVATAMGNSAMRGAARQSFPLVDRAFGTGDDGAVEAFARLLRTRYPNASNPPAASRQMVDFLSGRLDRNRSLVPLGPVTPGDLGPRSFAPPPELTEAERMLLGTGGGYQPFSAPQPVPSLSPVLTALFANSALQAPYDARQNL